MFAPESIVEDDHKNLYVGLRDGKIVKIYPSKLDKVGEGKIEKLFNGKLNTSLTTSLSHGIPLGIHLLIVCNLDIFIKTAFIYQYS